MALAHSTLFRASPRATVAMAAITDAIGDDFGMTPAAPAASASRTAATRSAMLCTSTALPVASTSRTLSVTFEPSPSDRSSTATSHARPSSAARSWGTSVVSATTSYPASRQAARSPSRTASWSSTIATVAAAVVSPVTPLPSASHDSGQPRDRLDVVRVREQIDRTQRVEPVPPLGEVAHVAGERHGVAGDVDELTWRELGEAVDDLAARSRAGRVEHDRRVAEPGALGAGLRDERVEVAVDPSGDGPRPDPLREVLAGVLGRTSVGFDRRHAHSRTEPVADRGREQPDAAVEVLVRGMRIEALRIDQLLHRARQGGRRAAVHLPEPVAIDAEPPLADDLLDDRRLATRHPPLALHDHGGCARGRRQQVDRAGAGEPLAERSDLGELGHRQRYGCDGHDGVGSRRVRPDPAVGVHMEAHAGAPSRSLLEGDTRSEHRIDGDHVDVPLDATHAAERVVQ